jgi:undecaprenyl diphosphate synthase
MPRPTFAQPQRLPGHVAIILDGNGRWATSRGLPRATGHACGARAVRPVIEAAAGSGIATLTLFAFSCDNWRRPAAEVGALMALLTTTLRRELTAFARHGVRLTFIGRRDRLDPGLLTALEAAERDTAEGLGLHVRIALDYSARHAIVQAARALAEAPNLDVDAFAHLIAGAPPGATGVEAVDLLIRTGGEKRLSDFLLWECAYAELAFLDTLWPDFTPDHLAAAISDYASRDRRFGGLKSCDRGALAQTA